MPVWKKNSAKDDSERLREEVEMVEELYPEFTQEAYLNAEISPVFFGSAINNFGVKELLDCFIEIAPKAGIEQDRRTRNSAYRGYV